MSEGHDIESVIASVDGLQEMVIPAVSTTKYLQLILPENTKHTSHT